MTPGSPPQPLVYFTLAGQRYALPLSCVDSVILAVEPSPAPSAPPSIIGLIDFHGEKLPLYDLRPALEGLSTPVQPEDQIILLRTPGGRKVGLLAQDASLQPTSSPGSSPAKTVLHGSNPPATSVAPEDSSILLRELDSLFPPMVPLPVST